jgi:hypothetical protein
MDSYTLTVIPSEKRTRILLTHGPDELMRAILPPASRMRYDRAAPTLLEGLAMWLDQPLHVLLSADAQNVWSSMGLTDEVGLGVHGLFYRVLLIEPSLRRRATRIRGIGDFSDARQLVLAHGGRK